jgi:hypothetical protein
MELIFVQVVHPAKCPSLCIQASWNRVVGEEKAEDEAETETKRKREDVGVGVVEAVVGGVAQGMVRVANNFEASQEEEIPAGLPQLLELAVHYRTKIGLSFLHSLVVSYLSHLSSAA